MTVDIIFSLAIRITRIRGTKIGIVCFYRVYLNSGYTHFNISVVTLYNTIVTLESHEDWCGNDH